MDNLRAYKFGPCISSAPLSVVYQATHVESGLAVAVKRLQIAAMPAEAQKECETEINLLQMLDHPHLIKYHAHFRHDDELYVVMELASGGNLAQKVENSKKSNTRIDERLLWKWVYDVASALAYLHRQRVLHRDVKPAHIFIGQAEQAKLGEFGLSKAMSLHTQCANSVVGTPFYMSPEIVLGEGYSFGSDIWSLGCCIYEMAVGYPPFFRNDSDFVALGDAICSATYPALPPDVWSKDFIDLVGQILVVNPAHRPSAQQILDLVGCKVVSHMQADGKAAPRLQDFDIVGTIGRGKFSEVHRSLQKTDDGVREVALKRIQIFDMDSDARKECNDEVDMLRRLGHPTIIEYIDSFTEGAELIIVLELAAHGDLSNLLRQIKQDARSFAETQVWAIFYQVSDALNHMHRNRIMHRDIKPENIFVCEKGVVKLGDLGLGRYFSSNTYRAHSVVGTPFYMSPEVITSCGGYSFKSDIWSMGCVLYELSALRGPFTCPGSNYYILGNRIASGEYTPLPEGTSPRVCGLCYDTIRVEQEARPDAATVWTIAGRHLTDCMPASRTAPDEVVDISEVEQDPTQRRLTQAASVVTEVLEGTSPGRPPLPRKAVAPEMAKLAQSQARPHSGPELGGARRHVQSMDARRPVKADQVQMPLPPLRRAGSTPSHTASVSLSPRPPEGEAPTTRRIMVGRGVSPRSSMGSARESSPRNTPTQVSTSQRVALAPLRLSSPSKVRSDQPAPPPPQYAPPASMRSASATARLDGAALSARAPSPRAPLAPLRGPVAPRSARRGPRRPGGAISPPLA